MPLLVTSRSITPSCETWLLPKAMRRTFDGLSRARASSTSVLSVLYGIMFASASVSSLHVTIREHTSDVILRWRGLETLTTQSQ